MAVYKVIQDVEAEDKLIGPLTLKQFIFAAVAFGSAFIAFLIASKTNALAFIPFLPLIIIPGILAAPLGKDQPTDIWLAAQIRFRIKSRKRIWDQSGIKNLVTITAPKKAEKQYTDGLSQQEVKSRLKALAETIDSHGWAIKNADLNLFTAPAYASNIQSDRLVEATSLPQVVPDVDIAASDDILDARNNEVAQHFDEMVKESTAGQRQTAIDRMHEVMQHNAGLAQAPPDSVMFNTQVVAPSQDEPQDSFLTEEDGPAPSADDLSLLQEIEIKHRQADEIAHLTAPHHRSVQAPDATATNASDQDQNQQAQAVTPPTNPDIVNLVNTDFSVATIAGLANRKIQEGGKEVVINLR